MWDDISRPSWGSSSLPEVVAATVLKVVQLGTLSLTTLSAMWSAYLLHGERCQSNLAWDIAAAIHHSLNHVGMAVFIAKLFAHSLFAHSLAWDIAAAIDVGQGCVHLQTFRTLLVQYCYSIHCSLLINSTCYDCLICSPYLLHCCCHWPLSEPCGTAQNGRVHKD